MIIQQEFLSDNTLGRQHCFDNCLPPFAFRSAVCGWLGPKNKDVASRASQAG